MVGVGGGGGGGGGPLMDIPDEAPHDAGLQLPLGHLVTHPQTDKVLSIVVL